VADAVRDGDGTDELAQRLSTSFSFSEARAENIARTEIARADSEGAIAGWEESGIVKGKSWLTAGDDRVSEECMRNQAKGVVSLDYVYEFGVKSPPQHPRCRCTLLPELFEEEAA
jgi:SPP1 gp7 family putative phage head morphogenesis protein